MKKKLSVIMAVVLTVALGLVGCAQSTPGSAGTGSSTGKTETTETSKSKVLKVGMSWAMKNDSLMYAMEDTLTNAMDNLASERGYDEVEWIHVIANNDAQKQASDIEDLITKKVDLIVCYAFDAEAIKSSIESAHKANIPFMCYDRNATDGGERPDAFIGLDTTDQAYTTGVELFKTMKDAGVEPTNVISIIGSLSDQNALNRQAGFKRAADEFGVTIKQEVPSEWDANIALQGFSAAFQANPDTNCVLIASDFIITSVQSVLEKAGRWIPAGEEGHIWVGSQDVYPISIDFIQDGYIDFDTAYDLEAMAAAFAPVAYDLVEGKKLDDPNVFVSGKVIDKANVETTELWAKNYQD